MDFVRNYFGANEPLTSFVLHFFPDQHQINADLDKMEEKSVQLIRGSFVE
jgi:hypothetical protein